VPIVAIFNGIIIQMFFEDHAPPHVHAIYSDAKALGSAMVRLSEAPSLGSRRNW
jgi:hypothetical protein